MEIPILKSRKELLRRIEKPGAAGGDDDICNLMGLSGWKGRKETERNLLDPIQHFTKNANYKSDVSAFSPGVGSSSSSRGKANLQGKWVNRKYLTGRSSRGDPM